MMIKKLKSWNVPETTTSKLELNIVENVAKRWNMMKLHAA